MSFKFKALYFKIYALNFSIHVNVFLKISSFYYNLIENFSPPIRNTFCFWLGESGGEGRGEGVPQ